MLPNLDIFFAPICHLIKSSPATTYLQDIKIKVMVLILCTLFHTFFRNKRFMYDEIVSRNVRQFHCKHKSLIY